MKNSFTLSEYATYAGASGNKLQGAFTLAEVLITLGIIGIVAAMTLPTVINNSRNKQLEAGLKRSYSVISQALDLYQAQTGERICAGNIDGHQLKLILMKYLKVERDCGSGVSSFTECINDYDRMKYKNYNGTSDMGTTRFDDGAFVLNDGTFIVLENAPLQTNGGVIEISVDVNGCNKRPNRLGQDFFMFQVDDKGKLLPMGLENTEFYHYKDAHCSLTQNHNLNGAGCTYKALTDKDFFKNLPK